LLLFSDGLSEAENKDAGEYGEDRLVEILSIERHREPDALLEFLLGSVRDFAGATPQSDDITAMIVRCPVV